MEDSVRSERIDGEVAPGFEAVREAFVANFEEDRDVGAACCVYVEGRPVVDLWGGSTDAGSKLPWRRDTLVPVFSATKGATTIVCHRLAERGQLDLDAPVAAIWPEFGIEDKDEITTRTILTHRAGLPAIERRLSREELLARTPVVTALASQRPLWEPETDYGYHALTFGWLLDEIVRRATGRSISAILAAEVAGPLGLDLFIGLPEAEESRVAALNDPPPPDPAALAQIKDPAALEIVMKMGAAMQDPDSLLSRALSSNGALPTPRADSWNRRDVHGAELPAANGITDARSLARMYAACIGEVDGVRLLAEETVDAAVAERSSGPDRVLFIPNRFGSGFMLDSAPVPMLSGASFGHTGAGGALAFADREAGVAFAFTPNQLGGGPSGDPRTGTLISALRTSLG